MRFIKTFENHNEPYSEEDMIEWVKWEFEDSEDIELLDVKCSAAEIKYRGVGKSTEYTIEMMQSHKELKDRYITYSDEPHSSKYSKAVAYKNESIIEKLCKKYNLTHYSSAMSVKTKGNELGLYDHSLVIVKVY